MISPCHESTHSIDQAPALIGDDNCAQNVRTINSPDTTLASAKKSDSCTLNESLALANIIGESSAIKKVRFLIATHSRYDAPVLVTGETGTGKELAARGLHYTGSRCAQAFVAINCATLTDDLFMSEIFGHVKGAFTDAKKNKKGLLEAADKGTLFLDEIDSLSLKSQAALLRFLQEKEYRPVGSETTYKADVRLIASANCDLEAKIKQGLFRADLYYRLYILSVHMPPLRHREADVKILADHFIAQFDYQYGIGLKVLSPELLSLFEQLDWPGNVRELENLIHRLYLCSAGAVIGIDDLDDGFSKISQQRQYHIDQLPASSDVFDYSSEADLGDIGDDEGYNFSRDKRIAVEQFEKRYVENILQKTQGNVTLAAQICGKERRAFGKLVKKYGIKKSISSICED
ncbi:sigma-54 interaction domain-containing protein [Eionea flava]